MLRRPGPTLVLAALSALALALTGVVAKLVPIGQASDGRTLHGFVGLDRPRLTPALNDVAHLADPAPYALAGLLMVLVALLRGRWRTALAIPAILTLAGATSEQLKAVLASPRAEEWLGRHQIAAASWPSGHATAAMALALCAVLASPPRLRPTVALLGGGFAIAVAYAILALAWHFPSDVLGGYLVSATYVLLALAVLAAAERRWPSRPRNEAPATAVDVVPAAAIALAAACAAVGLALTRPHLLVGYATTHTTFVVGAGVIAALALALAIALAAAVPRPALAAATPPAPTTARRRRWPRGSG